MMMTATQLMTEASAVSCTEDEFGTKTKHISKMLTANPILCPCVKHVMFAFAVLDRLYCVALQTVPWTVQ
jgi:hypothetical protein